MPLFLAGGGLGGLVGVAVGASLGRRPRAATVVAGAVAVAGVLAAFWFLELAETGGESCEGESCGLGEFLFALALGANTAGWLVGILAGALLRRAFGSRRRRDHA